MSTTLRATFKTRRDAEMTVERLVQEQEVERTDIFILAEGDRNSAGAERSGSDSKAGTPSPAIRRDAALSGLISVSVDLQNDDRAPAIRAAFSEFRAVEVAER